MDKEDKEERDKFYSIPVNSANREADLNWLFDKLGAIGYRCFGNECQNTAAINMLKTIMHLPLFPDSFTAFIEVGYVDRIYRDIFYHHYASRHFEQSRNCLRLFLFDGIGANPGVLEEETDATKRFIGVCVIQPNGIIGRSYWSPQYFLDNSFYVRTAKFSINLLGRNLQIQAFPYTMQDQEATTCAEVTVLNLMEYYSKKYPEYRSILLSDIEKVEEQHSAERIFPSQGMNYADVSRNLIQSGLSPRIYASRAPQMTQEAMRHYLYYYVESGIPFALAVESPQQGVYHSVVCIGHGRRENNWPDGCERLYLNKTFEENGDVNFQTCWIVNSADAYQTFIVMDDNNPPYQTVKLEMPTTEWQPPRTLENGTIQFTVEQLCVPLYKRIFLEVDGAAEVFTTLLTSKMGLRAVMERNGEKKWQEIGESRENPLVIRMFQASSRTFLYNRMQMLDKMGDKMDDYCTEVYQNLYCPRFIWVCELYTKELFRGENPHPIGEIVVDATARRTGGMSGINAVVLVHYPKYLTYRDPDSDVADLESNQKSFKTWTPFEQFRGNLNHG